MADSNFWNHHAKLKDTPESTRINGIHYRLGNPVWSDTRDKFLLGFGGRKFTIKFHDGRQVTTNNLWHQGQIPIEYAGLLSDNAEFVV